MFDRYRLHHVGVVLPDLEEVATFMAAQGLCEDYRGFVEPWSCWCVFTKPAAGAAIELVVPVGGPLAKFNKGAGGVHHFAYEVDDIVAAQTWVERQGMRMIEPQAIKGAGDFLCNFLSPASTRGINVELVQPLGRFGGRKRLISRPRLRPPRACSFRARVKAGVIRWSGRSGSPPRTSEGGG